MSTDREQILGDVRRALANANRAPVPVARGYRHSTPSANPVALFAERVADYRAVVELCSAGDVEERIFAALPAGARVLVPAGLPWAVPSAVVDTGFSTTALDEFDAAVTGASVGIAETGTIILTHRAEEGRRAISLVPDLHVCVVLGAQVFDSVPDAVAVLAGDSVTTWISGPSATSDIELSRVEGVHGPRRLHVIVVVDGATD